MYSLVKKLISKIINKFYIIYIKIFEKKFDKGNKSIKYMFIRNKSDKLVVVFSGFAAKKNRPVYNMVRTLNDVKINKLFILDDFGYEKRGSYYLGEDGEFFVENLVSDLINKIRKEENIKEIYCVGSSKGGSAAIYFGLKHNVDFIIAGAPQYFIGNYLGSSKELLKILSSIIGKSDTNAINLLNNIIKDKIVNYKDVCNTKMLLHYSKNEHTYSEHIIFMLKDLKRYGFSIEEDIEQYNNHSDVAKYFPSLCRTRLKELSIKSTIN